MIFFAMHSQKVEIEVSHACDIDVCRLFDEVPFLFGPAVFQGHDTAAGLFRAENGDIGVLENVSLLRRCTEVGTGFVVDLGRPFVAVLFAAGEDGGEEPG